MRKLAVLMSTIILLLAGCGTSAYANAMKDATSEVENGEYEKALKSLDVALEEKPEDKEARTLYENIKALNQVKEAIDGTDWEVALTKAKNLLKEDRLAKGIKAEAEQYITQAESELAANKEDMNSKEEVVAESGTNASEKEEAVNTEEKPTAEKAKSNIAVSEKEVEANTEKKSIDKTEKANSELAASKEEVTNKEKEKAASEREKYLKKLNDIKKGLAEFDNALAGTQVEMTQAKGEIFKRWDTALNEIYGALENQLSTSKFESLREEQRKWLTYRDEVAKENSLKFEGGTMASLEYISTQARLTEERCYELVEGYME
ncbi:lysozyme inhibitor LprI family protein [Peribacillus loiseleuriae]|uniref:lysozyme inhibitor LprI family protein n=1 Tax=Peribacillus loiseleuriae TaxID=1679170 RepID=UPI00069F7CED|nr:lysozyme inhibitor LprI family protein [Peribacillus loiseleuriae]